MWVVASCITCNWLLFSFAAEALISGTHIFILEFNNHNELIPELILLSLANLGVLYFVIQWFRGKLEIILK